MKKKTSYIEFLRVLATFIVVIDHVAVVALSQFPKQATVNKSIIYYSLRHSFHAAVPIFVMITGYLLLNPEREIPLEKIIKKYVFKILVVLFSFGTFYSWLELIFDSHKISILQLPKAIYNVIIGKTWDHMWYLYMLIGLYFIIPILKKFINSATKKDLDYFLIINIIFLSIFPMINYLLKINIGFTIPIATLYPAYLVLGYYIGNDYISIKNKYLFLIGAIDILVFISASVLDMKYGLTQFRKLGEFNSIFVLSFGIFLFMIIKQAKDFCNKHYNIIIKLISRCSFGIYIIHMFFINILYKVLKLNPLNYNSLILIPFAIIVFALSFISTYIFTKIPIIKKYI